MAEHGASEYDDDMPIWLVGSIWVISRFLLTLILRTF